MIAVPPWVLGASVLLAGYGTISATPAVKDEDETTNEPGTLEAGSIEVFGLTLCGCGVWLLWIGPNPELPSAWIAIGLGTIAGAALAINSTSSARATTGLTMIGTTGLMAATFIVRASLPGFE